MVTIAAVAAENCHDDCCLIELFFSGFSLSLATHTPKSKTGQAYLASCAHFQLAAGLLFRLNDADEDRSRARAKQRTTLGVSTPLLRILKHHKVSHSGSTVNCQHFFFSLLSAPAPSNNWIISRAIRVHKGPRTSVASSRSAPTAPAVACLLLFRGLFLFGCSVNS